MISRAWLLRPILGVLLALPATLLAQVTLELKVPDDQKSTSVVKITTKQTLTLAGMAIDTGSEQEMKIATANGKRNAEGVIRQDQRIESLKAKLSLPGGINLEYDSAQPDAPAPGTQFDIVLELLKVNAKSSWTVVRGKDNRVTAVEGREKVLEGLDETKRAILQKQLDPAYLRDTANKELDKLPSKPVQPGDTWEVSETIRLEQGQNMTFKTKYTYRGPVDRNGRMLDEITAEVQEVNYSIDADAALPLKVTSSDLKPVKSESAVLFDREKGMTAESRSTVQIKGTINFEAGGNAIPAELDLTLSTSSITQ